MGTSASSKGPGGGVPMVPPWVPPASPNPPQDGDGAAPTDGDGPDGQLPTGPNQSPPQQPAQAQPSPLAPAARFGGTRLNLGKFARGGDRRDMRRGLRDYVRKGYGGRATAVKRFGGTASTAGTLYGALSSVAGGQAASPGSPLDPVLLAGRAAREVMDAIVEAVRPADGTQDAEASRAAIKDALSELLTIFPDADLLNLSEDQRGAAIERFVAIDVYRRAVLDIGKTIQDKAPTATVGLARLKEVKDYIKQTVAAAFRKLRAAGDRVTTGRVNQFVRAALGETFQVFEAYVR
ncbi:MAG: hypothetical protein IH604_09130 [Burkholderiales bacterium]|nr:hypothetical protein [Burkholderiales bacterium]